MIGANRYYLRRPDFVAVTTGDHLLIVDGEGRCHRAPTAAVAVWSGLLQDLLAPMAGRELLARLAAFDLDEAEATRAVIDSGMLATAPSAAALLELRDRLLGDNRGFHVEPGPPACPHLVLAMTGSVVAGLMAPTVLSLAHSGFQSQLDVILTASALRFATRDLFESYGIRTWVDPFERRDGIHVPHVHLAQAASCVLVMPSSASSLQRLASGACSDLLSLLVSATAAPIVVAPAMNDAMWNHRPVQRNVTRLRDDGVSVIEPGLIFAASALAGGGAPMCGGPGTLWRGPLGVMQTLAAILDHHRTSSAISAMTDGSAPPVSVMTHRGA